MISLTASHLILHWNQGESEDVCPVPRIFCLLHFALSGLNFSLNHILTTMYWFPMAAITKYHELDRLFRSLHSSTLEVPSQAASQLIRGLQRRAPSLPLPSFWWLLATLGGPGLVVLQTTFLPS